MVTRQFIADFYWRMANQDRKALNKIIGKLEKCIAIDNNNALFHFSLGRTYLRKGLGNPAKQSEKNRWVRKAIDEFHKAIKRKPSDSDYHFHLGISYGSLGYPPPFYWGVIQNSLNRTVMLHSTNAPHLRSIGIYYVNEYHRLKNIGRTIDEIGLTNNKDYLAMSKDNYELYFRKLVEVNEEYLGEVLEECFSVTKKYADLKTVIRDTARSHAFLARFLKILISPIHFQRGEILKMPSFGGKNKK
jgi:tetratricopeptide (TPR) repeat protein